MKVLVTGSKGFVGKNLCSVLALRGDIELLEFDLGNTPEELQSAALAADFIIHLAGVNRPLSQDEFLTGNAGLTSDIVDAGRARQPVRQEQEARRGCRV